MPRAPRVCVGGIVYHVMNRANARVPIFEAEGDYRAFLGIMAEAHEKVDMRLLTYCIMPNHWHMVLWPPADDDLSRFMQWLTVTHAHRWQAFRDVIGFGHVYQGRFKSFPVEDDRHYLTVCRYVERNALRAGLVKRAEDWPWSSAHQRAQAPAKGFPPLAEGPLPLPGNWIDLLNEAQPRKDEDAIRASIQRGRPFGGESWSIAVARQLKLTSTLRPRGRPPV